MAHTTTTAAAGDDDSPRAARRRTLGNPTSRYQSGGFGAWWGYSAATMDGAPFFTWWDIPRMLRDPRVRFAERMWRAPFQRVKFRVKAEHPKVARYVLATFERFWRGSLPRLLSRYFRYGYAPGGAEFMLHKGHVRLDRVRMIEPRDATPRVWASGPRAGQAAGFTIGAGGPINPEGRSQQFVGPRHAVWFAGHQELSPFYDMPPIAGMFEPWLEKRGRNGAVHARRLWYRKCAFNGGTIYHPPGVSNLGTDESPRLIDNQDLARQLLEYMEAGAVMTFVNEMNAGMPSKYAWEFIPATAQPDVKGVREYPQDLDREMLEGVGIPPEVLEASEVGSGWSGRLIPMIGFLGGVDELAGMWVECVNGPIRHAVAANFGRGTWYEITPKSLAEEAQSAAQSGPGGGEGPNPVAGLFGGGPKGQPKPTSASLSDGRTDVWDAAVRQARRKAKRRQARELSWESYTGSHGGHGWKNSDSGEIRYQSEKPAEGDGDGETPSDAGEIHRRADSKASKILKLTMRVPKRVLGKVRDKAKSEYAKLEGRYGPRYAKAIIGAGVIGLPIPFPGASMALMAGVRAVAELHRQLSGPTKAGDGDRGGEADPKVVKPAARSFLNKIFGRARTTLHLSWADLPDEQTDGVGHAGSRREGPALPKGDPSDRGPEGS